MRRDQYEFIIFGCFLLAASIPYGTVPYRYKHTGTGIATARIELNERVFSVLPWSELGMGVVTDSPVGMVA
jgi:hypothetical protein